MAILVKARLSFLVSELPARRKLSSIEVTLPNLLTLVFVEVDEKDGHILAQKQGHATTTYHFVDRK